MSDRESVMRFDAMFAQTEEIQREVETRLWFQRVYESFGVGGIPPLVVILTLVAVILVAVAGVWLWYSRQRRG